VGLGHRSRSPRPSNLEGGVTRRTGDDPRERSRSGCTACSERSTIEGLDVAQVIDAFQGEHRFLSNFYAPATFSWQGWEWMTSEHAYQAAKTDDLAQARVIQNALTPGIAKRQGKLVVLRPGWESIKVATMESIVFEKFRQNPALAAKLRSTGDALLVEGNAWGDRFWGVCGGAGENQLGRVLMRVRARL
jgi:ribA/ribD-fused uncharacterized protein